MPFLERWLYIFALKMSASDKGKPLSFKVEKIVKAVSSSFVVIGNKIALFNK